MIHKLPELPFAFDALEPYIDEQTMHIHYEKHHAAYVTNLNAALDQHPELKEKKLESLLADLESVPEDIRTTVRNNGGGHYNHSLFWSMLRKPTESNKPTGTIMKAIENTFGSFDSFTETFNKAGLGRFGSGWVWLVIKSGEPEVMSTANQDSPLIEGLSPVLGCDVWEHAYYLKYQNKRADYLSAWWNVVNWERAEELFSASH